MHVNGLSVWKQTAWWLLGKSIFVLFEVRLLWSSAWGRGCLGKKRRGKKWRRRIWDKEGHKVKHVHNEAPRFQPQAHEVPDINHPSLTPAAPAYEPSDEDRGQVSTTPQDLTAFITCRLIHSDPSLIMAFQLSGNPVSSVTDAPTGPGVVLSL